MDEGLGQKIFILLLYCWVGLPLDSRFAGITMKAEAAGMSGPFRNAMLRPIDYSGLIPTYHTICYSMDEIMKREEIPGPLQRSNSLLIRIHSNDPASTPQHGIANDITSREGKAGQ